MHLKMLEIGISIVVSIPACHAGDRSSILRYRAFFSSKILKLNKIILKNLLKNITKITKYFFTKYKKSYKNVKARRN